MMILNIKNSNFDFFADKTDILIKNIFGNIDEIKISDGDLKIKFTRWNEIKFKF